MDSVNQIKADHEDFIFNKTKRKTKTKKKHIIQKPKIELKINIINPVEDDSGYVYFIFMKELKDKNLVKVGQTKNLSNRLSCLQTGNPFSLEIYKAIKSSQYKILETKFHDKFKSKNVRLEWFNLSFAEIDIAVDQMIKETNDVIVEKELITKLSNVNIFDDYINI
jgi:hypothetical protein